MSMPSSAMARIARGCTDVFSVPALPASKRLPAMERRRPSAIWLRAELCVQRNSTRDRAISASRWLVDEPLHDDAIPPLPVELAVTVIGADHPESAPRMKSQACRVLGKDPGHDLPEAALGIGPAERLQRLTSRSSAPGRPGHVHGVLSHAGIGRTTAVGSGACPCHDPSVSLHHHGGEAIALVDELLGQLLRGTRFRLECGDAVGNALVVDRRDARRVSGGSLAASEGCHWIGTEAVTGCVTRRWCKAAASGVQYSSMAEATAPAPAMPRLTNAHPHAPARSRPYQSRIAPKSRGATAPAPYPSSDRRASAAPR